eukprot:TRINITY_DN9757_c0_g1_i3.p1 TRINITY_DN9757_c0_g1~~TRINITY_DN9757_c0_g1_i3.p1  ORF type:complete len:460 (-),score=51.22 TRINITY_DN9757_c0_g1_i3:66-1373(-)
MSKDNFAISISANALQKEENASSHSKSKVVTTPLMIVYANLALYALAFQMMVPVLPFLIKSMGENVAVEYGYLQSTFSLAQLIGVMVSGPLIDMYGSKFMLLLSFGSSLVTYTMMGTAKTLPMLYLSKVPTFLQHGILGSRAFISEVTDESVRARMLGYAGFAYGIGMAIGPTFGGFLARYSLRLPAAVAAVFSFLNLICIGLFVQEPKKAKLIVPATVDPSQQSSESSHNALHHAAPKNKFNWAELVRVISLSGVGSLLFAKLFYYMAASVFQAVFALIAVDHFHLNAQQLGLSISYCGVMYGLSQGVLTGWLTARYPESSISKWSIFVLMLTFASFMWATSLIELYTLLTPLFLTASVYTTINTAQLTKIVSETDYGTMLGIDMGISSGTRLISAALGSALLASSFGYTGVCVLCTTLNLIVFVLMQLNLILY